MSQIGIKSHSNPLAACSDGRIWQICKWIKYLYYSGICCLFLSLLMFGFDILNFGSTYLFITIASFLLSIGVNLDISPKIYRKIMDAWETSIAAYFILLDIFL